MKQWDVVIVGGGVIGLTLAISLHKCGMKPLVVERGEPGREASYAAGGMLANCNLEVDSPLFALGQESAALYPEFVRELQDESGIQVDLRDAGTIVLRPSDNQRRNATPLAVSVLTLEPGLAAIADDAVFFRERSVDPRLLIAGLVGSLKRRDIDLVSGAEVLDIVREEGLFSIKTSRSKYRAPVVVNCAGSWAGQITAHKMPVRPVKGQMLSVVGVPARSLHHVVRSPKVYLIPRSDGRIVIGATLEEAGYDKRTDPDTINDLLHAAVELVPALSQGRIHEAWAGLRPGTPDGLPILGPTRTPGYFVATGHFRDGILLAPITAQLMTALIRNEAPCHNMAVFSPHRF